MSAIKVLLVDDEDVCRETLGKRLGKRGMIVRQACSGEEALDAMQDEEADVVLLDVKMSGMDGLTALHKIKLEWPLAEVLMLTGHASVEVAIRGMELGAFDYLMKPVEFEELLYKLEDAYTRRKHQEGRVEAKTHTE